MTGALSSVGAFLGQHKVAAALTVGAGVIIGGAILNSCADNTPPPVGANPEEQNLIDRLRTNAQPFSNRQQTAVVGDVRANQWPANESGNMLTTVANHIGTYNAIDAWRLTKYNNRSTTEITGLVQALDATTSLYDSEIQRVVVDVLSTGYPVQQTKEYFQAAHLNPFTSNHDDIKYFEEFLGLRYPSWVYPGPDVIYEPYPKYYPDPSYPSTDWPKPDTSWGDDKPGVIFPTDPGYPSDPGTSNGDDGGYWKEPSTGGWKDDPIYDYPEVDDSSKWGDVDKFE